MLGVMWPMRSPGLRSHCRQCSGLPASARGVAPASLWIPFVVVAPAGVLGERDRRTSAIASAPTAERRARPPSRRSRMSHCPWWSSIDHPEAGRSRPAGPMPFVRILERPIARPRRRSNPSPAIPRRQGRTAAVGRGSVFPAPPRNWRSRISLAAPRTLPTSRPTRVRSMVNGRSSSPSRGSFPAAR